MNISKIDKKITYNLKHYSNFNRFQQLFEVMIHNYREYRQL